MGFCTPTRPEEECCVFKAQGAGSVASGHVRFPIYKWLLGAIAEFTLNLETDGLRKSGIGLGLEPQ